MAWEGSNRRARLPKDWPQRRARVLRRDHYACQTRTPTGKCFAPANEVDHIIRGDDHSEANLAAICTPHHREKTAAEAAAARRANPPLPRKRPKERHPGLLD